MTDKPDPVPHDSYERDDFGLTPMQRAFCDAYLFRMGEGEARGSKQAAALDAGYAPDNAGTAAFRNLRNPDCVRYIASQMTAATAKVPVDRSYVLFRALQVVERAEAKGEEMAVLRALELIARHVDVAALIGAKVGDGDAAGGAGLTLPFDLSSLSTDEKRLLLDLITRAAPGNGPAPQRVGGSPAPVDRRGRSEGEAGTD